MKDCNNILLKENVSIKKALKTISSGAKKIAIIINEDKTIIGTLTDGDIRSGLLQGLTLNDSIKNIISRQSIVCTLNDSKEEILDIALKNKVYQIPIVDNENKVIGIEEVNELIKPEEKSNRVILMVGGLGTRLKPMTETTPKPMLKVGDKPILETIIENFKKYGFNKITLCVNYKSEIIKEYFGNGSKFGVTIDYIYEQQRMGTVGALSLLEKIPSEPFFVMNGDLLTNINLEYMMKYHLMEEAVATMGVRQYDFQVPYGVISIEKNQITEIKEKPIQSYFVSGGIYILNPEVIEILPKGEYFDMPILFEKIIEKNCKTLPYYINDYWIDIGRREEYQQANDDYIKNFNKKR